MAVKERTQAHTEMTPGAMMGEALTASWLQAVLVVLGAWLVASPPTLGYHDTPLMVSDLASGLAMIALAAAAFFTRKPAFALANCVLGLWVVFSPLAFWAPTAAAYANDTLVGALAIAFSLIVPMRMRMKGPDVPPGWSYNPSTWQQRLPTIALGLVSFLAAHYMAAYQLGHLSSVWDPFFRPGTEGVLTSNVSKAWPISDAGLGAMIYLIETLSGLMGDERRWRTMPWMVAMFGFAVVPLGVVSVTLMIMQPVMVGTWCTLCLATAAFMIVMIPLSLDEVVAMGQFLVQKKREGHPFWRTFFLGGTVDEDVAVHRPSDVWKPEAGVWGMSVPWTLAASTALGLWLLFAPAALGSTGLAANGDFIAGGLAVTFAVIAWAEVGRAARFVNVAIALWLIAAPWWVAGYSTAGRWADVVVGLMLIALSIPRGAVRERYGSWERFIR